MNDYFNPSGAPSSKSSLSSSVMRSEIENIGNGFEKLPDLTGNSNLPIAVNSGASGLEAKTAAAFRTLISVLSSSEIDALITALNLGTASTNNTEDFAPATSLSSHTSATGTSVHGLGTASTQASTAFATAAQGTKADAAAPLSTLTSHTSATGTSVHGNGTAAAATLTTSTTDTNSGRVTKVNDYGIPNNTGTVVYGRSNIIGTVSQSGGIPTGGIVESSSTYTRWADGTQICVSNTGASALGEASITFGKAFSTTPTVTLGYYSSSLTGVRSPVMSAVSTTSVSFSVYDSSNARCSGNVKMIAIGRWF